MLEGYSAFYVFCAGVVLFYSAAGWLMLMENPPFNYGRMLSSISKIHLDPRLAWFLFQVPNLLWVLYFLLCGTLTPTVGLVLFTMHYLNRDIIYPLTLKTTTKVPLEIVVSAFSFTFANGYLQCVGAMADHSINRWVQAVGVAVFALGMWVNVKSDAMLQEAKQKVNKEEGQQSKYVVIRGFLFEYVSTPNYLGEIIEWAGYFLASQNPESLLFMISTFCVLTPGAIKRHRWNQANIAGYPVHRKALIPYVL